MPFECLGDEYALRGRMNVALRHCFQPVRLLAVQIGAGEPPVTRLSVRCLPAPISQNIKQGASYRYRVQGSLSPGAPLSAVFKLPTEVGNNEPISALSGLLHR